MSINTSELMIGNWLHHNEEWSYRNENKKEFIFQWEERDWFALQECTITVDQISPIVITPKILIACGFVKQNNGWHLEKDHKVGYNVDRFGLFDDNYCEGELDLKLNGAYLPMPEVKYLHKLQNLFFELTGERLTYNTKL